MKELKGLTSKEVKELQEKYGKNELSLEKHKPFIFKIFEILCEPMFTFCITYLFCFRRTKGWNNYAYICYRYYNDRHNSRMENG